MDSVYIIFETDHPDALLSLAGRILAYKALDRQCRILFRLKGICWLSSQPPFAQLSHDLVQWLESQEFADLQAYWSMAVAVAEPELYYCESSVVTVDEIKTQAQEGSLVRFMLQAQEAGTDVVWI